MPERHTMIYNTIVNDEIRKCSFSIQEPSAFDTLYDNSIFNDRADSVIRQLLSRVNTAVLIDRKLIISILRVMYEKGSAGISPE